MPLDIDHIDEVCDDIRQQYESGVTSCALFYGPLVPSGTPVVDKAKILCEKYDLFKEKLSRYGVSTGILVQATIGHGYSLGGLSPYQQYINLSDGGKAHTYCPYDEGFKEYIYNAMRTVALHKPDCIMVDDDFRLITRWGKGCACPLHLKRINELAKTDYSREELKEVLFSDTDESKRMMKIYVDTQKESLIEAAKAMRAGIDSVDKTLPGTFCCVGNNAEFAGEIAQILAGEGNPVVVRLNNGNYAVAGAKYISDSFFKAAAQKAKLKDKVDVFLAETDTCPQNRYSTSAMGLHSHFTGTILEGAAGAKHWITRLHAYEPESGKMYRKVLSKHTAFYEELAQIVPKLKWRGFRLPVLTQTEFHFTDEWDSAKDRVNEWGHCVLEKLGLPMYFSEEPGGVLCLEGDIDTNYTDEEIMEFLKQPVFIASDTAQNLIARGFGEYLGVDVKDWNGKPLSGERLFINGNITSCQKNAKELVPLFDDVIEDSFVYNTLDRVNYERLFPGTTIYKNKLGGTIFVFCGTPKAKHYYREGFAFLNYSRKQQIIKMLETAGELLVYYPNDEEVYMRAADMDDGTIFAAIFNIGFDPIEKTEIVSTKKLTEIKKLMPDGTKCDVDFEYKDGKYILNTSCNTLDPLILFMK